MLARVKDKQFSGEWFDFMGDSKDSKLLGGIRIKKSKRVFFCFNGSHFSILDVFFRNFSMCFNVLFGNDVNWELSPEFEMTSDFEFTLGFSWTHPSGRAG